MKSGFAPAERRLGLAASVAVATLLAAYAVTLTIGLATLPSPDAPIGDPLFTILEILILALMPAMVAMTVAIHAWAAPAAKSTALASVVFMALTAGLTMTLHFAILTLGRESEFADTTWWPRVMAFEWPSVAYAVDVLAWDVLFALSMLFAAPVFSGRGLARAIRVAMIVSGVLALAGLSGVVAGDMALRNIGIVGYVPVFFVVTVLVGRLFAKTPV